MSLVIEELKEGIKQLVEIHGRTSKMKIVRQLFIPLTEAMKDGVKLELINNYLNEQGLEVTLTSLRTMIYRIRKERGLSAQKRSAQDLNIQPQPQHQKITSDSSLAISEINTDKKTLFEAAMEKHSAATNLSEKFIALGGEPSDIINKPDSQIRHIYTKQKIKFNRLYEEFL
ncbi:hypothetical protein GNP61_08140 [Aliivibrio fischeri]|uniref:hypothetical protein n=1 Tax=Aliivibrio fischeri TaxID=668 RepID=UPI0012DAE4AD|nr:hypothetical protein [Aliivibrio fischeri]MUK41531.1 hypothetical protein [Aliivibrio fischeri]